MRRHLTIAIATVALALSSGCHRRFVEGRRAPAAEPVTVDVGTTTTTGADVPREEIRHEAWGPLPAAPLSEPLVTPAPSAPPTTEATTPPAPAPAPSPSEQKEEEPPRRVGPPSAADPHEWGGS